MLEVSSSELNHSFGTDTQMRQVETYYDTTQSATCFQPTLMNAAIKYFDIIRAGTYLYYLNERKKKLSNSFMFSFMCSFQSIKEK